MSAVLIVRVNVTRYDAWRTAFDANAHWRRGHGVISEEVYCSPEDMTVVVVLLDFDALEGAQLFAADPELAEAMKASGAFGTPRIIIAEVA